MKGKRNTPLNLICSICGVPFESFTNKQASAKYVICGKKECRLAYISIKQHTNCPVCGEPMYKRAKSQKCRSCYDKEYHGPNTAPWKGGRITNKDGYVLIKTEDGGYVPEHRLVWEANHGPLKPDEAVHHINGIRNDNRPENLIALTKREHVLTHWPKGQIPNGR